jgi:hypothetical protein
MTRFNKKRFLTMQMLFLVTIPNFVFAQPPPPSVPVNDYSNHMITAMVVFLLCFFYFKEYRNDNFKKKSNKKTI